MKIQIILGSTRPGRAGEAVAQWAMQELSKRTDAEFELVDVADYALPLLDEPTPPMMHHYTKAHTKKWAAKIAQADGYIFVTAEYDHSVPGALKNAIDYLNHEWRDKAAGFISYGVAGGARAVEHLRTILAEVHIADVREQVLLYLDRDFANYKDFTPADHHAEQLTKVADQVVRWAGALKTLRSA